VSACVFVVLELLRPTCIIGVPVLVSALRHDLEREVVATATASEESAAATQAAVVKRFGAHFDDKLEVVSSGTAPLSPQVRFPTRPSARATVHKRLASSCCRTRTRSVWR